MLETPGDCGPLTVMSAGVNVVKSIAWLKVTSTDAYAEFRKTGAIAKTEGPTGSGGRLSRNPD